MKIVFQIVKLIMLIGAAGTACFLVLSVSEVPLLRRAYVVSGSILTAVDIALLGAFLFAFVQLWKFRPDFDLQARPKRRTLTLQNAVLKERWTGIVKKFSETSPDSMRIAVIEADAFIDGILKQLGLGGEHMADRLARLNPEDASTLERLWRAHRIRNDVVHTPGFWLSPTDGKRALEDYEAFLKEIEVI